MRVGASSRARSASARRARPPARSAGAWRGPWRPPPGPARGCSGAPGGARSRVGALLGRQHLDHLGRVEERRRRGRAASPSRGRRRPGGRARSAVAGLRRGRRRPPRSSAADARRTASSAIAARARSAASPGVRAPSVSGMSHANSSPPTRATRSLARAPAPAGARAASRSTRVAHLVAVGVVDALEVVEVEQRQRRAAGRGGAARATSCARRSWKARWLREAGQRVGGRPPLRVGEARAASARAGARWPGPCWRAPPRLRATSSSASVSSRASASSTRSTPSRASRPPVTIDAWDSSSATTPRVTSAPSMPGMASAGRPASAASAGRRRALDRLDHGPAGRAREARDPARAERALGRGGDAGERLRQGQRGGEHLHGGLAHDAGARLGLPEVPDGVVQLPGDPLRDLLRREAGASLPLGALRSALEVRHPNVATNVHREAPSRMQSVCRSASGSPKWAADASIIPSAIAQRRRSET